MENNISIRKLKRSLSGDVSHRQREFILSCIRQKRKVRILQISIFILFILVWEVTAHFGIIDPFVFSSPSRMAILLWWNETVAKVSEPYLVVLNSLPKTALAPVFIVWLGNNMKTIIVAAVSVAVFGSIITLFTAFCSVEEEKIKLIRTLGGNRVDILRYIVLPGNAHTIVSNMKVNIGLSLVGVIIGEFLAANAGLGYLIVYGSQVFKLDYVILSIVILCIVATGLYKGLEALEKRW